MLCVWWCSGGLRSKLSLRDLPEMFLERGFVFTHEAVREWEVQLAPLVSEMLRKHRRGRIGPSWYVDETVRHEARYVHGARAPAARRRAANLSP